MATTEYKEPPSKRRCLEEIWYQINDGAMQILNHSPEEYPKKINAILPLPKPEYMVTHRSKILLPSGGIPCTSAEDPLVFLSEVGKLYVY